MAKLRWLRDEGGITEGTIWKQLLLFFFPILFGTFFQQMYNTVDAIIVGQGVGKEALAAVGGATGSLISLLTGFFVGLASGATVVISQFYGARDDAMVHKAVHTAAAMALLFGALLTLIGLTLSRQMLLWMDTPEDVLAHAVPYLKVYFCGMIPSLIYNIGSGVLRAVGDSKRPLYFLIAACMSNIVLDLFFVLVMKMGVTGAALATVLSQTISAVLVIVTLMRSKTSYRLAPTGIRFHTDLLGRIIHIGLPAGLQSVMYSISNVIIQRAMNSFSTDVLAGWTAYSKVDCIFWMLVNAFGISITTFVGQNFGAGKIDRVKKSVRVCLAMTAGSTLLVTALLLLFGRSVYHIFSSDEAVIEQGMIILKTLVPAYITYVCIEILSGAVRGTGDSVIPTVMILCGVCVLRLAWVAFVFPQHPQMQTVLLSYPITWSITSVLFIVYYLRGSWLRRALGRKKLQSDPMD